MYQEKDANAFAKVKQSLKEEGFEVLTDKQSFIIDKVKETVEQDLITNDGYSKNFASVVSEALHMDYDTISTLFSTTEGIKLEQYVINKRIEKVQEFLKFSQLTLTDIAFQLGYSSVHHLSNQFKKITGMSPSYYRELQAGAQETTKQSS